MYAYLHTYIHPTFAQHSLVSICNNIVWCMISCNYVCLLSELPFPSHSWCHTAINDPFLPWVEEALLYMCVSWHHKVQLHVGGGGEGRGRWGRGQGEVGERAGGGAVSPYLFYTLWWDATRATHPCCYEVVCSLSPKVICSHLFPSSVKGERRAVPLDCTSLHRRHHFVVISHWRDDFYCSLSACPIAL